MAENARTARTARTERKCRKMVEAYEETVVEGGDDKASEVTPEHGKLISNWSARTDVP